jgi:sigma-E factor negative regulatory protein RseA
MRDEVNQKISWLVDGELGHDETLDLLKKIQSDEALKNKMSRYQAISQALKTDEFYQVRSDFSHKVFQEIQQEPSYFLPQLKPQQPPQVPSIDKQSKRKLYAVAASTLIAAVVVGQNLRHDPTANKYQNVTAMAVSDQQLALSANQPDKLKQRRQPLNTEFKDYLQAHNSSVYTNGEVLLQPYAKVTAYGQE